MFFPQVDERIAAFSTVSDGRSKLAACRQTPESRRFLGLLRGRFTHGAY